MPTSAERLTRALGPIHCLSKANLRKKATPNVTAMMPIQLNQLPPITVSRSRRLTSCVAPAGAASSGFSIGTCRPNGVDATLVAWIRGGGGSFIHGWVARVSGVSAFDQVCTGGSAGGVATGVDWIGGCTGRWIGG